MISNTKSNLLNSRSLHLALLVVGCIFLLTDAFHGNIWFDESYSVAIARHSFADIWSIGSNDVHPVLFYWALHAIDLFAGQNIFVFRLFTIAGACALAALGYTHLRRDFGWKTGLLFTFFALFTPYIADMAVQIRMYSWATFAVMLCAIYAYRIFSTSRDSIRQARGQGNRETLDRESKTHNLIFSGIPWHWWLVFFAASLASAYLHYFGTLSAFVINVMLFVYLAFHGRSCWRSLLILLGGALVQVLLYLPWLTVLMGQLGVITGTYWVHFVFPTTVIELIAYPFYTSQISFALRGDYGLSIQITLTVALVVLLVMLAVLVVDLFLHWIHRKREAPKTEVKNGVPRKERLSGLPAWAIALLTYILIVALAWAISEMIGTLMLYYRYLFVAIGPLLFCCASLLAKAKWKLVSVGICMSVLAVTIVNQVLLISDDYSPENTDPIDYLATIIEPNELIVSSDIGIEGVTAVTYPETPQIYLDWQPGNWAKAYEAYAPTLRSVRSWGEALDGYEGRFIVLGATSDGSVPRDVQDILDTYDASTVEIKTFYRPYERTYFTIAILTK